MLICTSRFSICFSLKSLHLIIVRPLCFLVQMMNESFLDILKSSFQATVLNRLARSCPPGLQEERILLLIGCFRLKKKQKRKNIVLPKMLSIRNGAFLVIWCRRGCGNLFMKIYIFFVSLHYKNFQGRAL